MPVATSTTDRSAVHRGSARMLFGVLLTVVMLATLAPPVHADPAAARFKEEMVAIEAEQRRARAEADRLEQEQQRVREEQRRLDEKLQEATDRLAELEAEFAVLSNAADETARKIATLANRHVAHRTQLGDRARTLYQLGGVDPVLMMLGGASSDEVVDTAHYVAAMSNKDQTTIEGFEADTTRLGRLQADLLRDRREVAAVAEEVAQARAELDAALAEAVVAEEQLVELERQAQANLAKLENEERQRREQERRRLAEVERRRREEAARRAAEEAARREAAEEARRARSARTVSTAAAPAPAPPSSGGMVCPQGHPRSFSNDWGAPRSGGRRHQGTDVFGRMGGPVYAITDGVIQFTKVGGMPGLFLSLRGNDGHSYWYMHLSAFAASTGQRVSAGQLIGYNGDTGNAKGTPPHVHFEYHPGGGGPVNPYPLLRSIC